ncbi:hypothetical protein PAMC26510_25825 [Caballeronia sordidicola]|uniref:Uncharacterized protein n=1 Tax=Caballeronia sordidicola TaxID=196367 RepID=A0A242MGE1_CABSO|nr:hypothetical protein PAMC26510_25825 [Caballeronia sordidicola]
MATKGGTDNAVMLSVQVRQVAPSIDGKRSSNGASICNEYGD